MTRFDPMYEGTPPWDIGRPQPALVGVEVESPVLDVGCGTGENALYLAARGHEVVGIDYAARAIEKARAKAAERGVAVSFEVLDALELERLGRSFATAIDSGVFHVFDDAQRARYVESLGRAVRPGGRYIALVFSELEPTDWGGPRRVRRDELEAAFAHGWSVVAIERTRLDTHLHVQQGGGHAWMATFQRR
jgi:SAM-dependent methyltransferase